VGAGGLFHHALCLPRNIGRRFLDNPPVEGLGMGSLSLINVKSWVVLGVLLAVCFLTYHNSLHNPFMMDDHNIFSDVKLKNVKFLLNSFFYPSQYMDHGKTFTASGLYYRPMAYVISILSYLAFGNEPYGYHILNLFLFTLMCFTVYVFIDLFFKDKTLAFLASILFAVHPINVFFVNYNTSGIHSVRFIFMFLSVIFLLKALAGAHKIILYFISLLCFAVTLMCHETSIVLPFYILFALFFFHKQKLREALIKAWPYFFVFFLYLLLRLQFTRMPEGLTTSFSNLNPHGVIFLIGTFSKVIFFYFSKLLFPDVITLVWSILLTKNCIWMGGVLCLFLGWYLLWKSDSKSMPFFCMTWMLLGFLPVTAASMSDPHKGLVVEPQWLTFSSIGFFLYMAWAGLQLYVRVNKRAARLLIIFLLTMWVSVTRYNNWIWADEIRYYDFRVGNLDGTGHLDYATLGNIYRDRKNLFLAEFYYHKALREVPPESIAGVYNNLGLIDMGKGLLGQAKKDFLFSIKNKPQNYFALNNLALIYLKQGDYQSAKPLLLRALEFDRYSVEARLNLAFILEKELNDKEAVRLYIENLNIVPNEERSLLSLVRIYVRLGGTMEVRKYSQQLINHNHNPVILTKLGSVLAGFGQFLAASDAFSQAIRADAKYKEAYLEAGKLLANAHMYAEAMRVWQIGGKIDPIDPRFKGFIEDLSTRKAFDSITP
jgi:protein O-mannosyl-transferase